MKEPPASDCEVMVPAGADNMPESSAANTTCCLRCSIHSEGESVVRVSNPGDQLKRCPGETGEVRSSIRTTAATGTVTGDPGAQWPAGDGLQIDLSYGEGVYLQPCSLPGCDRYNAHAIHWDSDDGGIYANNISNRRPNGIEPHYLPSRTASDGVRDGPAPAYPLARPSGRTSERVLLFHRRRLRPAQPMLQALRGVERLKLYAQAEKVRGSWTISRLIRPPPSTRASRRSLPANGLEGSNLSTRWCIARSLMLRSSKVVNKRGPPMSAWLQWTTPHPGS